MDMIGLKYKGNLKLLKSAHKGIGVFASRAQDPIIAIEREKWSYTQGHFSKYILGTFHSSAEKEILYWTLNNGGSAIWFLGCSFPETLSPLCQKAIEKNRLLIISCFNRPHHNIDTAHYCIHLITMYTKHLVFWSCSNKSLLKPIKDRAIEKGYLVECF